MKHMFGIYIMAFFIYTGGIMAGLNDMQQELVSMWMDHFSYLPVQEAERHE